MLNMINREETEKCDVFTQHKAEEDKVKRYVLKAKDNLAAIMEKSQEYWDGTRDIIGSVVVYWSGKENYQKYQGKTVTLETLQEILQSFVGTWQI